MQAMRGFNAAMFERPFEGASEIVPSDTKTIPLTRAIYVGTGGDLRIAFSDHSVATLRGIKSGSVLPVRAQAILKKGTTAQHLTALY